MDTLNRASQRLSGLTTAAIVVFWVLVVVVILQLSVDLFAFYPATLAFLVPGVALIILASLAKIPSTLKMFLILVGSAAAVFFVSVEFSGLIYRPGIILAALVCPLVFLVGAVGSIVMLISGKHRL